MGFQEFDLPEDPELFAAFIKRKAPLKEVLKNLSEKITHINEVSRQIKTGEQEVEIKTVEPLI